MDRGTDFLKSQVNNAVMQHKSFLRALEDHESQAEDARYRDLCSRHIPNMREHQRMLEDYQKQIGAEAGEHLLECRNDPDHDHCGDDECHHQDRDRIEQRRDDERRGPAPRRRRTAFAPRQTAPAPFRR